MTAGRWQKSWCDHRALIALSAVYIVAVLAEAVYCGVPIGELAKIFGYILMAFMMGLSALTVLYFGAFLSIFARAPEKNIGPRFKASVARLDRVAREYLDGDRWSYACLAFAVMLADNFFFISKSLLSVVHPYARAKWDVAFAAVDKALDFGHYPHEYVIPLVNALHLSHVADASYALWLVVMFAFNAYNIFVDRCLHRRLRFLTVYLLSWILLGSVMATAFSSVGPLFFHNFYPALADPYAAINANLDRLSAQSFYFATMTRELLLGWASNGQRFNPNAISAMPSMHIAISWLMVLYAWQINRAFAFCMAAFGLCVFISTVYFGFHYAIDGYVPIVCVSLLWWLSGKSIDRRHARADVLKEEPLPLS